MPSLPHAPRSIGRTLRSGVALLIPLLLVTCTDQPTAPERAGIGTVRIAPVFNAYARIAPLALDSVQLLVVRPPSDTLARIGRKFNVTNPQLRLDVPVLLQGVGDDLEITLRLLAGTTLLFEGIDTIRVVPGGNPLPSGIPVTYKGPGSSIASLALAPRDTTIHPGDTLAFSLNALDSLQAPVAQYYVSWSLTGSAVPTGAKLDATGRLLAPALPGAFYVRVVTPTGVLDSTGITIAPRTPAGVVVWTGGVDTQWSTAGNWNAGALPSASDSVVIPLATRAPVLTAAAVAGAVRVTGGTLRLNGHSLTIARAFQTTGTGTLTMNDPADSLLVAGNVVFDGGSTAGLLTAGLLTVGGNFSQLAGSSPLSFAADTGHHTRLDATLPVISFASPGLTSSRYGVLEEGVADTGFQLGSDVAVAGYITSLQDGFGGSLHGSNAALTIPSLSSMRLDGVRLVIDDPNATQFGSMFGVQFSNLPTTVAQLTIRSPGNAVSNFTLSSVTFEPLTTGDAGTYVSALDIDGATPDRLIVYVDFDANGNGPAFTQVGGGAQVFWPSASFVWTGATSTDWHTNANWNTFRAPFQNAVVIPAGTPFSPQLASIGANEQSVVVQAGATLDLTNQALSVSSGLDASGPITGLSGASVTVTGNLRGQVDVPVNASSAVLSGNLTIGAGAGLSVAGNLDLAGNTLDISGNLVVNGLSSLTMASVAGTDSLLVAGSASMCGGTFSTGVVRVSGNFATCLTTAAYAPTGTHKTILGSANGSAITITNLAGVPTGSFHILDLSGATGGISLLSPIAVDSLLISTPTAGTPALFGGGNGLVTRRVQVSRLTLDQVPFNIDELGTALTQQFDNVTFQNDTTSTLLTLSLVGGAAAVRTVTFNSSTFSLNGSNLYVHLTSSNGLSATVVMNGSNNPTGGPSRSNPPFGQTAAGARIVWQ